MPTNEERREVAARLREAKIDHHGIQCSAHLADTGLPIAARIVSAHEDFVKDALIRLADLIEPEPERTCRWVEDENGTHHGECGLMWEFFTGGIGDNGVVYCPNCGCRVKED